MGRSWRRLFYWNHKPIYREIFSSWAHFILEKPCSSDIIKGVNSCIKKLHSAGLIASQSCVCCLITSLRTLLADPPCVHCKGLTCGLPKIVTSPWGNAAAEAVIGPLSQTRRNHEFGFRLRSSSFASVQGQSRHQEGIISLSAQFHIYTDSRSTWPCLIS